MHKEPQQNKIFRVICPSWQNLHNCLMKILIILSCGALLKTDFCPYKWTQNIKGSLSRFCSTTDTRFLTLAYFWPGKNNCHNMMKRRTGSLRWFFSFNCLQASIRVTPGDILSTPEKLESGNPCSQRSLWMVFSAHFRVFGAQIICSVMCPYFRVNCPD